MIFMAHHIRCPRLQLLLPSCQLTITLVLFKCNTAMSLGKADFFSRHWERTMVDQNQSCNVALWMGHSFNRRRQWHPTPVLLPGKSHGWRSLVGCSPWDREESDTTERLHFRFSLSCIGEGSGNPLQCSCLENPRDRGAWWAAVYGVARSRTRLKRLSSSSSSSIHYVTF